ncbi:MAG: sensor histidine kinase [Solirubrobacteraceae bacterium]
MASRGSSTRSAARATFSALKRRSPIARLPRALGRSPIARLPRLLDRLPIRWRLALTSALLTLTILLAFALLVGTLTTRRIRSDFDDDVRATADRVARSIPVSLNEGRARCRFRLGASEATIRVVTLDGTVICQTPSAPDLGPPLSGVGERYGYRVETRPVRPNSQVPSFPGASLAWLQVARPTSDVEETVQRVRLFLAVGVLAGAGLALLAGLAIARRAMSPIAELTAAARQVERTRDPSGRVPHPRADDEVAELARTLEGMLAALDASRSETEAMLARQREFVADASHELRTPLTSVLSNLEMLADQLEGEPAEAAGSALRSARRMRRLVADLLLLARADAGRTAPHAPVDLAELLAEAAGELEPVAAGHELSVAAAPANVWGARDELLRLVLNLLENALRHTPLGTRVQAATAVRDGQAVLEVSDDGPGVPPAVAPKIFERFVRGGGERAGSSGLGLAIVRAVAESHGGSVALDEHQAPIAGARFVVRLPTLRSASDLDDHREDHRPATQPVVHEGR